jgi:CYTH domain-containing protein
MPDVLPAGGSVFGIEIERKFRLRAAPSPEVLAAHRAQARRMEQIYLTEPPTGRRIRRIERADGTVEHRLTRKERVGDFRFHEQEEAITADRFEALRLEADPDRAPIRKTRFVVPHGSQLLEIDVFESPPGLVVLEVELATEDEPVLLPDWVGEWREVTGEPEYLNVNLAKRGTPVPAW